jgi:hypothetical protein
MPRSISVRSGFQVQLPEPYGEKDGPVTLTISDEAYAKIPSSSFHASNAAIPLIDNGAVGGGNDAVVNQAPVVTALGAMTATQTADGTYDATEQAMLNALKADMTSVYAKVNAILTALKTTGGPMANS